MKWLLIPLLLIITSCFTMRPSKEKDYAYEKNGYKVLYSDTIRYSCGKTKVIHYYKE